MALGVTGRLPGTSGDYFTTVEAAAHDITGDIGFIAYIKPDLPSSAPGPYSIFSKGAAAPNFSYQFDVNNTTLRLVWSEDGTTFINRSVAMDASTYWAGTSLWVYTFLDVSTGQTYFKWSTNGASWNDFPDPATLGATSIAATTSVPTIGARTTGTNLFIGDIYVVELYSGDPLNGGTLVADFDTRRDATKGAATMTSSTTSEVWTPQGDASFDRDESWYVDFPGGNSDVATTPDAAAFDITQDFTFVVHFVEFPPAGTNDYARIVDKGWVSPNFTYILARRNAGNGSDITFNASADGTTSTSIEEVFQATDTYVSDGVWVKMESIWGGASRTTTWYTSVDGKNWTSREVDTGGAQTINTGAVQLAIGNSADALADLGLDCKIGRLKIYDGDEATGTLVADFNPDDAANTAATSWTADVTGEVWTLGGSADIQSQDKTDDQGVTGAMVGKTIGVQVPPTIEHD